MSISFHSLQPTYNIPKKADIKDWIRKIISGYNLKTGDISIIFVSDDDLLEINKKYLSHDYFTDIVTFDYREGDLISGDIYISIPRVEENSKKYHTVFQTELLRVIIHGIFHLLGFADKSGIQKKNMRKLEDEALLMFVSSR